VSSQSARSRRLASATKDCGPGEARESAAALRIPCPLRKTDQLIRYVTEPAEAGAARPLLCLWRRANGGAR
jgi:hypothetical protein